MFKNTLIHITAILLAIVCLGMSQQATAQQTTVYVDAQSSNTAAPSGANPGNGWGSAAYKFLQHGLTRATQLIPSDTNPIEVHVRGATGAGLVYYPDRDSVNPNGTNPADRTRRFELLTNVAVRGGYVGTVQDPTTRAPNTYITILSGDIDQDGPTGDNSYHVVNGAFGLALNDDDSAHADGLTIKHGLANVFFASGGAGVLVEGNATVYLRDCKITDNRADSLGGGVLIGSGGDLILRNCTVSNNETRDTSGTLVGDGGGIFAASTGATATFINTIFEDNASSEGGAYSSSRSSTVKFIDCTIKGNTATNRGGGISTVATSTQNTALEMVNCLIVSNTVTAGSGEGGGVAVRADTTLTMTNCTLSANTAANGGGLHHAGSNSSVIRNSILWNNTGSTGAEIRNFSGSIDATNSDIRDRLGSGVSGTVSFTDCIGENTTGHDPNFMSPTTGNYRLQCRSLAVNGGLDSVVPCDANDVDENGVTCGGTPQSTPELDLGQRIIGIVDMGAYEKTAIACNANIINTGASENQVNIDDLLAVVSGWGPCQLPPAACAADIFPNPCGNGVVNIDDLLAVISGWGCCPGHTCTPGDIPDEFYDCWDACSGKPDFAGCMDDCFKALCELGHTEYCD